MIAVRLPRRSRATAFLWGFAEATLFFVVPDVAISWIALTAGLRAAAFAALLAAAGAACGGGVVHLWSKADPAGAARIVELVPAVPAGAVDQAGAKLRRGDGMAAALAGAFQGEPYKVWSAAAPAAGWSLPGWMLAAFPIRGPRFLLVAGCFALIGQAVRGRVRARTALGLFAAGWSGFYILFWSLASW